MWKMSGFRRRIISAKPDVWDVKMKYGLYVSYPNSYRERARLHEYPRPTCFVSAHSSNFRWLTDWGFHKRRGSERRRGWLTGRLKIFLLRFTTLRFAYLFIVTAKKKKGSLKRCEDNLYVQTSISSTFITANRVILLPFKPHCALSCGYVKPAHCVLFHGTPAGRS